jgi:chromosome segregation protein
MRLKRLELQGFKSFLDRTILNFEPGITGVVGPNGCGKSNIVDAILWVMGEQSPKHLRGDTMTDVIFAGSDSKSATSFAEVSLILDRESVALAPTFSAFDKGEEISITRRLYRDGHGEFLINKTACRLKDIHELFMDTGVGRRAYSIIEQGQIDRMINVKPEERRYLFEEVAGITKYKAKRKEAERKLDQTRQNLLRLQDIVTELEKQIRSLKTQATRARKYKELKTELEAADLFLIGRELYEHQLKQDSLKSKVDEVQANRAEADALFAQSDALATELEIERIDLEKKLQALSEKERELSLRVQRLESESELLDERRKNLESAQADSLNEEQELDSQIETAEGTLAGLEQERIAIGEEIAGKLEIEIQELEIQLREHQDTVARRQRERSGLISNRNALAEKRVQLANQCSFAEVRERECQAKQQEINEKLTAAVVEIDTRKARLEQSQHQLEGTVQRTEEANAEAARIHSECEGISENLSELESRIAVQREKFHSERSRLRSLQELQENLEGYSPTAREILSKLGSECGAVPFAEIFQPDSSIEEHLEALLGNEMNTLVVNAAADAEKVVRLIQEQGLERVKVIATQDLVAPATSSVRQYPGTVALETLLKIRPGYETAVQWRLGDTFVCEDLNALFQLRAQFPGVTFLSRDTRSVAHSDRALSSGNPPTKVGVFARRREIEALTATSAELERSVEALETTRTETLGRLETHEMLQTEWKEKLSALHIEAIEIRKERERLQHELNRADRDYSDLCNDSQRNVEKLEAAGHQREAASIELAEVSEREVTVSAELEQAEAFLEGSSERFETLSLEVQQRKVDRSRLDEKKKGLAQSIQRLQDQMHDWHRRLKHLQEQRLEEQEELAGIGLKVDECHEQRAMSSEELGQVRVAMSDTKELFNAACERLQNLRSSLSGLQSRRDGVVRQLQETEIALAQAQSGLARLREIAEERYQTLPTLLDETVLMDLEKLPLFAADLDLSWDSLAPHDREKLLAEHVKSVRDKVSRYGEVNLTAIQEYEEVEKRYAFLAEQKADLENSITILEEAIQKIDFSTISRFTDTFEAVRKKFNEIFPILFNGGKAELIMTNPDNPLEAGVDIMVQPPGKRLQSISLLSGGEKALTAVSLVLAIFARKPSPFCLLDEVDAPLDDANVSRFNTVVRKMAEKTQFIVITHNKKTMEIAEALYGVTMERAGISKMASVRLH